MELFKYQKDWTTFLDDNFEVLLKSLSLTNSLLVELRNKKVLSCLQFEGIMAFGEARRIERAQQFLEDLRSDLASANLAVLISVLQNSDFRCISAAKVFQSFAVQIGIHVPVSPRQDQLTSSLPITNGRRTLNGTAQWLSLLIQKHMDFRKHIRALDAKQLSKLVVLGCINEEESIQIALIPRSQMKDKIDHFLAILADKPPPHKTLLDKLILAFDSPVNSKTSQTFRNIRSEMLLS